MCNDAKQRRQYDPCKFKEFYQFRQIIVMSKPSIKFIYSGQIRSEVQQLQKGPSQLQAFPGYSMQMQYEQPPSNSTANQPAFAPAPIISSMEVNSRTSLQLNRHRSNDNFPPLPRNNGEFETNTPILNIEEVNESEVQMISQKQPQVEPKRTSRALGEQIVLKAPSYKYTPKREGELVVHSRKQYKKASSVERPLNNETILKSKKPPRNPDSQKQFQLRSSNPILQVETIKESDFHLEQKSTPASTLKKPSKKQIDFNDFSDFNEQIVLKAPKYKYIPKAEGELAVHRKKQYVKAENTEKYLYEGVKAHREKDFISCFGCAEPTAKTYKAQDD